MRHDEHYVEALTSSAGAPIGRMIPIDLVDPAHFQGLWRTPSGNVVPLAQPLAVLGRSLEDYAAVVGGAA